MWNKVAFYRTITHILTFVLCVVVLVIITGTVVALLRQEKPHTTLEPMPSPQHTSYFLRDGKAIYSDLGQLRALSADTLPATIVLNPYLEYDAENIPLQEELVKKKELIRNTIIAWFAQRTWLSVETMSESEIKKELLKKINDELSLGVCSSIYFAQFKVLH